MNDGTRYHAGPPDSINSTGLSGSTDLARPRRRGTGGRIGWITASRLAAGRGTARGGEQLHALLTAAATIPGRDDVDPAQSAELSTVLAAFRRAGDSAVRSARATARPRALRLALVKCAAVLFIIGGTGLAVASAGVLPDPMQRFAHDYFGAVGVPAPSSSAASPGTSGSPSAHPSPSPSSAATSAVSAGMAALCNTVAEDPQNWRADLTKTQQATLVSAAGGNEKVVAYCTGLIATAGRSGNERSGSDQGNGDSASAVPTSAASAAGGDAQPTATHGNPHPSRSASPGPPTAKPSPSPDTHGGASH